MYKYNIVSKWPLYVNIPVPHAIMHLKYHKMLFWGQIPGGSFFFGSWGWTNYISKVSIQIRVFWVFTGFVGFRKLENLSYNIV